MALLCEHCIRLLESNHKLCIVTGYISLPPGSPLSPPLHHPPCILPRISHSLIPPSRHASAGHLRGGKRSPLPGDSLQGDVGNPLSQLEERGDEGGMLRIRASTERNSASVICSRKTRRVAFSRFNLNVLFLFIIPITEKRRRC